MRLFLCLVLLFGLAAPARASVNLLPNGDFEQGFVGWERTGDWQIVSLDGHAAGIALGKRASAQLCTTTQAPALPARLTLTYLLRGGAGIVSVGQQVFVLAPASEPTKFQAALMPALTASPVDVCVRVRGETRFVVDDIALVTVGP